MVNISAGAWCIHNRPESRSTMILKWKMVQQPFPCR